MGKFKITLANEQRDLDSFVNEIFNPINGQEYPVIEKGIGKWINQKIDEGTRDIRKTMILTVTCRAHSLKKLRHTLQRLTLHCQIFSVT